MTKLSPAAQFVLAACEHAVNKLPLSAPPESFSICLISAALRAAADQVVPAALEEEFHYRNQALPLRKMVEIRQKLNAIATELEAQP